MAIKSETKFAGRVHRVYDSTTGCTLRVDAPIVFHEPFYGLVEAVKWTNLGTANSATVAGVAGEGGHLQLALTADSEAQDAGVSFGDALAFNLSYGLNFEFRAAYSTALTSGTDSVLGLASATNATLDTIAVNAWFRLLGAAPTSLLVETDDNSNNDDDNATGIANPSTTFHVFRIDATDLSAVKFYVDGVQATGTYDMSNATSTTGRVQPYFIVRKASGTLGRHDQDRRRVGVVAGRGGLGLRGAGVGLAPGPALALLEACVDCRRICWTTSPKRRRLRWSCIRRTQIPAAVAGRSAIRERFDWSARPGFAIA